MVGTRVILLCMKQKQLFSYKPIIQHKTTRTTKEELVELSMKGTGFALANHKQQK